eukprot:2692908-Pyramimonas_sp.AAC.1
MLRWRLNYTLKRSRPPSLKLLQTLKRVYAARQRKPHFDEHHPILEAAAGFESECSWRSATGGRRRRRGMTGRNG